MFIKWIIKRRHVIRFINSINVFNIYLFIKITLSHKKLTQDPDTPAIWDRIILYQCRPKLSILIYNEYSLKYHYFKTYNYVWHVINK